MQYSHLRRCSSIGGQWLAILLAWRMRPRRAGLQIAHSPSIFTLHNLKMSIDNQGWLAFQIAVNVTITMIFR